MTSQRLRIGTRGSALALWQARETARLLEAVGYETEIVPIRTMGDVRRDVPLASIGGKGLFVKELEEALDRKEIDLAVHSLKDVPSLVSDRFALAGFLERADPRDAWLHAEATLLADLPDGAIVGTSAPRRRAQLAARFPVLRIDEIRGNVDTRIEKLRQGRYAGIVLAGAGLTRLGRVNEITSWFSVDELVPAAGQGIIAVECLTENETVREAARSITHGPSALAARCERGVLEQFGAQLDCDSAVAVHCEAGEGGALTMTAFLADLEGKNVIRTRRSGSDAADLVDAVYRELVAQGAEELLCINRKD